MNAIDAQQKELQDILRRTGEVKSNIARDEAMFGESKAYIERKQTRTFRSTSVLNKQRNCLIT
jgi:hypothetical protein